MSQFKTGPRLSSHAKSDAPPPVPNQVVEQRPIDSIHPYPKNARLHPRRQLEELARSITEFGFRQPLLIDEGDVILTGHGRYAAAKHLGLQTVPVIRATGLSEKQKRAFRIADNKIALNARWDEEILIEEIKLIIDDADADIDLDLLGFSAAEVDVLSASVAHEDEGDPRDDRLPRASEAPRRCKPGDLWALGPHRLICADARDVAAIGQLMDGSLASMVFCDPPYNVTVAGIGSRGRIRHREFAMASGEMTGQQFEAFLASSFEVLQRFSVDGSIHYVTMDWRHMDPLLRAGKNYAELKNLIVWVKDNAGLGSFYRSQHELIFVFKHGLAPHQNNFELGQHGRHRTNVWQYRGLTSQSKQRSSLLAMHPTVKPVAMIADAIRDVSSRGQIVLDVFGGSGTTLVAAHKTGRRGYLSEIDPAYCDCILARWEVYAHDEAKLVSRVDGAPS